MSFFDFGTGHSLLAADKRKDDRASVAVKLKAKLRELRAAGLDLELEDDVMADEAMHETPMEIVAS